MYVYCDGTLTVTMMNHLSCDNWVQVSPENLLAEFASTTLLSAADFSLLATGTIIIFMAAFGAKMVLKVVMVNQGE